MINYRRFSHKRLFRLREIETPAMLGTTQRAKNFEIVTAKTNVPKPILRPAVRNGSKPNRGRVVVPILPLSLLEGHLATANAVA